ncbi:MAG TPA: uracil-DNA glycosylase family protein [Candidatus Thermoplasmatota archaeon]|nr:uracil-DNA glycosylase family protein [Candidatus Thermoplasmatota archaeon]
MRLVDAAARLRDACAGVVVEGAAYAYHPLAYAWDPHERFLRAYGEAQGRAVFVGMNPGPWGMAQTGVPFADVAWAHGWMGIIGDVGQPERAHPKRPVLGYASTRSDPSGGKFYGWAKRRFGTAERFFAEFFVLNYCPLLFLEEGGRNVPLPQLRKQDLERLAPACDAWLREALDALAPRLVLPMGAFVEARVRAAAGEAPVRAVRHPSPANPANNAGWGEELDDLVGKRAEPA